MISKKISKIILMFFSRAGLVVLMTNSFGNYVVQKLFDLCDDRSKRKIYDKVRQENLEEIKKNSFGRFHF